MWTSRRSYRFSMVFLLCCLAGSIVYWHLAILTRSFLHARGAEVSLNSTILSTLFHGSKKLDNGSHSPATYPPPLAPKYLPINRTALNGSLPPAAYSPPLAPKQVLVNDTALGVTVALSGRLGNHMFQYASLLGIAYLNGRKPFYPASSVIRRHFHVTHVTDPPPHDHPFHDFSEKNFATYNPSFERLPHVNVRLNGYLQSWRYFQSIRDTIKTELSFLPHVQDLAARLLHKHQARTANKTRVAVHVRRGDMVGSYSGAGYHIAPASYVIRAMNYMRHKYDDVIFLVVTDDRAWCSRELQAVSDVIIADSAPGEVHLALMTSCDHVIMTVGTFGWWGGYLCGGEVVYYWDKHCLHDPPLRAEIRTPRDYYPPRWTPLPA